MLARVSEGICLPADDWPLIPVEIEGHRWGLCTKCPAAWAVRDGVLLRMPVSSRGAAEAGQQR